MEILSDYKLPDADLIRSANGKSRHLIWAPESVMVVIGNGSDPHTELHINAITQDNIPVIRRDTGGCAVILTPEMFVASFALYGGGSTDSIRYFKLFNGVIINALNKLGTKGVAHEGRSDIAINGRKIAGTAIYRSRSVIFYHAIINAGGSTELMEKYLKMPPREPAYRKGRTHRDFVTSLAEQGHILLIEDFRKAIDDECRSSLNETAIASLLDLK